MDDSDDYVLDDIVLDDQTLAVLDQEEQKYLHQSSLFQSSSTPPDRPINKRHKTNSGWTPGIGASVLAGDEDDLPEISLRADGSYGVMNRMNATTSRPVTGGQRNGPYIVPQKPVKVVQPTHVLPRNAQPRALSRPDNPRHTALRQSEPVRKPANQNQNHSQTTKSHDLQAQVLELQRKLDELREDNTKVQTALKDAIDMKMAKEGEVSILRKAIEKNAQVHAAQVSQLRSEKEKADAKQVQLQNKMKEDMDRLRTQFLFKQQELEASIRVKPPASVKAKKIGRADFPPTPLAIPSSMRSWNNAPEASTSRWLVTETPSRGPGPPPLFKASPSKQLPKSPEKRRKNATLPGFQNAFDTSTPIRSPSRRAAKGKAKTEQIFGGDSINDPLSPSQRSPILSQLQFEPPPSICPPPAAMNNLPSSNISAPASSRPDDDGMDIVVADSEEDVAGEDDPFESINLKNELCRIILTHSHPSNEQTTFQRLLSSTLLVKDSSLFSAYCSKTLAVLATSVKGDDYESSLQVISLSFLYILIALHESNQLLPLAILLDLLTKLILSLPRFQDAFLSAQVIVGPEEAVSAISGISQIIQQHLSHNLEHAHREILSQETLSFLESVCFHASPISLQRLEVFARNRKALMILFHPSQSNRFLERSSRMLAILSSHHALYEALLCANDNLGHPDQPIKDPLLDLLCSHLIDSTRPPTDVVKIQILVSFAQLSIAHPDGHGIMARSYTLIPSLILYTSFLTSPLWEDDERLTSSPEETLSLIRLINQATYLLYHLIFDTNPCLNLRSKLQQAQLRPFISINHIFIVTFGRLSYCDPPSWINPRGRQELEHLAEASRDILEVVVDGPEGDSVWAAFQSEPDEENAMDEEEMEARFMGNGV
ncbi:unnamed protein product [Cyclocybe aegerita]|uniref:Rad26 atrip n=1 Tax=Cyclocybe aegerita TaxID=1973307 RepID=A0A8S0W1V0_CYCAE|nr:unnamed protein product [Cyclocybe aegerita]